LKSNIQNHLDIMDW